MIINDGVTAAERSHHGEPVLITDLITCPHCGAASAIGDCPIVATATTASTTRSAGGDALAAFANADFGDEFHEDEPIGRESPSSRVAPMSGAPEIRWAGPHRTYPVLAEGQLVGHRARNSSMLRKLAASTPELVPIAELASPEDKPARLCPHCERPLPGDIDSREIMFIAVVGVTRATKTHYLGSMLHAATSLQALYGPLECSEFRPDEHTAKRFDQEFYRKIFANIGKYEATQVVDPHERELAYRATFRDGRRRTLVFYDIAGEVLEDRARRLRDAPFLRQPAGIIFLIDPQWSPPIAKVLRERYQTAPADVFGPNQVALIDAVLDGLSRNVDVSRIPIAIAISKSDLLEAALGDHHRFAQDPPASRDEWMKDLNIVDEELRHLLKNDLLMMDLYVGLKDRPNVTFHAIAPIGVQSNNERIEFSSIRPKRCFDPLASVLVRATNSAI